MPIILNVHFPHNVPKNARCLQFGHALYRAIKSFKGFGRVALMASGGLTHFVIDEELDKTILDAMEKGDEEALEQIPENVFKVGTAETKNWYPVIAAMQRRRPEVSPGGLRALLSLGSRHRQRDGVRVLGLDSLLLSARPPCRTKLSLSTFVFAPSFSSARAPVSASIIM